MKRIMGLQDIIFMNVVAVLSLRWIAVAGSYGASSVVLWLIAAILFFIPLGLVSSELATAWPEEGGVYVWIREAFGEKVGFLTSWFYWTNSFFYYPSLLTFIAVTLSFLINPALATNKIYVCSTVLIGLWGITIINLKSMRVLKWISNFGGVLGVIVPGIIIVLLGFAAVFVWKLPVPTNYSLAKFWPDFSSSSNIVFLATLMFSMAGIELTPTLAGETENPKKTFPRAIFIAAICIFAIYSLGTIAMTLMIAPDKMGAASGIMDAIKSVATQLHLPFITSIVALLLILSNVGAASVWLVVPIKMLLESCKGGVLPKTFTKMSADGIPRNAIIIQSSVVTISVLSTSLLASVNAFYEIMILMATITYFIPYLALFSAFLKLRKTHPHRARPYKIPGGKIGAWVVALIGLFAVSTAIFLPFLIPPQDIKTTHDIIFYRLEIIFGPLFFAAIGYGIFAFHERRKKFL